MSIDDVRDRLYEAVVCLCDKGSFEKRLETVALSALQGLRYDDLKGVVPDDLQESLDGRLKIILDLVKSTSEGETLGASERRRLVCTITAVRL